MRWGIRGALVAFGIVLAAILPTFYAVFLIGEANQQQSWAEGQGDAEANRINAAIESSCRELPPQRRANCIQQKKQASSQKYQDAADLEAQRVTAAWTHYMGVAAILGTAFGVLGIALVLATFWENKRAADAAQDANRPWIEIEPHNLRIELTSVGMAMSGEICAINHGNSPATNVIVQGALGLKPVVDEMTPSLDFTAIEAKLNAWERNHAGRGKIAYPQKPVDLIFLADLTVDQIRNIEGPDGENCHWILAVGAAYRFGTKRCRTLGFYVLATPDGRDIVGGPYNVAPGVTLVLRDADVKAIDTHESVAI